MDGFIKTIQQLFNKRILRPIFSISKLGRNIIGGSADSGLNIDHIYRKHPKGITPVGKFVDSVLLNLPTVKATRRKKDIIIKIILNEIENNIFFGKKTRILDLASGPARYLVDLVDEHSKNHVEALCLDIDKRSVNFGKILAGNKPIRYARANLFSLGHLKNFSKKVNWIPDIIMTTGFFEMQSDEVVKSFLAEIYKHLSCGGLVLFTAQASNSNADLMKDIGLTMNGKKWTMFLRSPRQYRQWLLEAGFRDVIISLDNMGMYEYCTGRKI
ncbi:MAG: class I SAM-dependent methyltransferase family protein [Candidatus Omnitrophica bacterium]|nr:class I SAM-dependent methyltransferase family protein [Candidatus Omnitrophota bacterium]